VASFLGGKPHGTFASREVPTSGLVAQRSELAANNRLVGSSSPPSPTTQSRASRDFPVLYENPQLAGTRFREDLYYRLAVLIKITATIAPKL
jgi:hypothetical protein